MARTINVLSDLTGASLVFWGVYRRCAVASVAWVAWPKARIVAVLAVVAVVGALVGDNYHFVGDCVAGGLLGSLGGVWAARLLLTHVSGSTFQVSASLKPET